MKQPLPVLWQLSNYVARKKFQGEKRYPMVLMLEPTLKCNLTCTGCGKIRQDEEMMHGMMTVQECLDAVDECGVPAVSIAGGEPLVHPEIDKIVQGIIDRKKMVMLCTNGILLDRALKKIRPNPYFSFVFHIDGLREHHDKMVEREGVYDIVIEGIRKSKRAGYRVATNTTLYKGADADEIAQLFRLLMELDVDGVIVSPAFSYEEVDSSLDIFPTREEAIQLFRTIHEKAGANIRYWNTPQYIDFLKGEREYQCTPWGNPTRDPNGWKGPCYLLTDGRYSSFEDLMEKTPWKNYGYGKNPRCSKCMMHCGYEATTILEAGPMDMFKMMSSTLS